MHLLVLGGSGFIGSHIVARLLAEGHKVRVFDRGRHADQRIPGAEYCQGDFGNQIELADALANIDGVIHAISTTVPGSSNLNPVADIETNLINSINLLQLMHKANIRRIVYLSSGGTIYGVPNFLPITEDHPQNPICSYGVVKLAVEKYLFLFQHLYGLSPIILRVSNPFGPGPVRLGIQGAIATFMDRIAQNEPIQIWGDGSVVRDYLFIDDLIDACMLAFKSQETGVFNIGSSTGYSLKEVISILEQVMDKKAIVEFKSSRKFDIQEVILDCQLANDKLGWKPIIPMEQGIRVFYDWYSNQLINAK